MRYDDNVELRELLSAEYALGTLRGPARRRYERLVQSRVAWRDSADWWQYRLALLADTVSPVQPAPRVWQSIQNNLYGRVSAAYSWWRGLALASSGLALVLAIVVASNLLQTPQAITPQAPVVALLNDAQAKPGWILALSTTAQGVTVMRASAQPDLVTDTEHAFELWVLPADKSKPISIGVLPQRGNAVMTIQPEIALLLASSGLAVSLEPPGGSPTGQPTGAVLYQGKLSQV